MIVLVFTGSQREIITHKSAGSNSMENCALFPDKFCPLSVVGNYCSDISLIEEKGE